MTAATANLINAISLISMSLWGYFGSVTPSQTAFISVAFGVILLALNTGVKRENKLQAHLAVTITLLALIGLILPLRISLDTNDTLGGIRVMVMIFTSIIALVMFVRSFIKARKARNTV